MFDALVANLGPKGLVPVLLIGCLAVAGTIIAVVSILATSLRHASVGRTRSELTRAMLDRGMSPDEIVKVLDLQGHDLPGNPEQLPCACEALVERDGEWATALVLQIAQGRCLVHHVGEDMDANEWVGLDRLRFPTGSPLPAMIATSHSGDALRNGQYAKPAVEQEV